MCLENVFFIKNKFLFHEPKKIWTKQQTNTWDFNWNLRNISTEL